MSVIVNLDSPNQGDQKQLNLVAAAITVGLEAHGFKDVRLVMKYPVMDEMEVAEGTDGMDLSEPFDLLESVRRHAPELFAEPVLVVAPILDRERPMLETVFDTVGGAERHYPDLDTWHTANPRSNASSLPSFNNDENEPIAMFLDGICYAVPQGSVDALKAGKLVDPGTGKPFVLRPAGD